jgi:hypothetical protein
MFEEEDARYDGVTAGGMNKEVKDTTDFMVPRSMSPTDTKYKELDVQRWKKANDFLERELSRNVKKYIQSLDKINETNENSDHPFKTFPRPFLSHYEFMIQKYEKNKGRYVYHNDFQSEWPEKKYRVITFLWYLNDVEQGGETEMWDDFFIKPEAGKCRFPTINTLLPDGCICMNKRRSIHNIPRIGKCLQRVSRGMKIAVPIRVRTLSYGR